MRSAAKRLVNRVLRRGPAPELHGLYSTTDVAAYYDQFTDIYLRATGDFIQAYRSQDVDALMSCLVDSMEIEDGMHILDAGCGVGAPALWLAARFPALRLTCLTNSARQYALASERIAAAGAGERVALLRGDYHAVAQLCAPGSYDRVMFIESMGHSHDPAAVLRGVRLVLRRGGSVYIKDFFQRTAPDQAGRAAIARVIEVVNRNYVYNVMRLPALVEAIANTGFSLDFARRPAIKPDLGLTVAFENQAGRLTYPAFSEVRAVDWFEVAATLD